MFVIKYVSTSDSNVCVTISGLSGSRPLNDCSINSDNKDACVVTLVI